MSCGPTCDDRRPGDEPPAVTLNVAMRELRPGELILDLFGAFVRDAGGWIAVADLVALLGTLGVDERSARAAVSRMKSGGDLSAGTRDGRRGYTLSERAAAWFADGDERILRAEGTPESSSWLLVSFSVPEHERAARYRLRTRLQALGFGQVASGLMIAPNRVRDETIGALRRDGLDRYVELWDAAHAGLVPTRDMVARAWDLDALRAAYDDYAGVVAALPIGDHLSDEAAFTGYVMNIDAWRPLTYLDPGIPLDHLPAGWPSAFAHAAFLATSTRLRPGAWRYFTNGTRPNRPPAPAPGASPR